MQSTLENQNKHNAGFWGSVILVTTGVVFIVGRTALGSYAMNTPWTVLLLACQACCVGLYVYNFRLSFDGGKPAQWLRQNSLLLAYFLVRILSLFIFGCTWSGIQSIYIEFFCLMIVSRYLTANQKDPELFFKFFIWAVFICNILALAIAPAFSFLGERLHWGSGAVNVINAVFLKGQIFTNVNFLGMMTGLALVLSAVYIKPKKWWYVCYVLISLLYLVSVNCRSAEIGLIAAALGYLAVKYIKKVTPQKCLVIALALSICYLGLIFYTVGANSGQNRTFTPWETKLNQLGSSRYQFEKYMILSMDTKNWIMGVGSYAAIGEQRYAWVEDPQHGLSLHTIRGFGLPLMKGANNHNSYMDLIVANGAVCFLLFLGIMIQRIKKIRPPGLKRYYLPILYIMIMANFETVITYRHYHMFFMLMLLLVLAEGFGRGESSGGEKETGIVL